MRHKLAHIHLMSDGYAHLFGVLFHIKLTKKILNSMSQAVSWYTSYKQLQPAIDDWRFLQKLRCEDYVQ
jgi:hypothetical protein